ncbi:MAG: hypothetical protein E7166_01010 [Firmicutes bacterium]|nr:hypothetical protein [Bacillota bacterium]
MKEKNNKQRMTVLAKTCNRPFVVAPEKAEEFNNLKPNLEVLKKNEEMLKRATNIKVCIEPIKPKTLNISLKKR